MKGPATGGFATALKYTFCLLASQSASMHALYKIPGEVNKTVSIALGQSEGRRTSEKEQRVGRAPVSKDIPVD